MATTSATTASRASSAGACCSSGHIDQPGQQAALPDAIVRHQVREPLAVLLSMHKITSRGMRVLRRLIGYNGPTTEMLVRAYLELNRRAEQLTDDRYKVEDAAQIYQYFNDRPDHKNSRRHHLGTSRLDKSTQNGQKFYMGEGRPHSFRFAKIGMPTTFYALLPLSPRWYGTIKTENVHIIRLQGYTKNDANYQNSPPRY